jgi:hypothetical protein
MKTFLTALIFLLLMNGCAEKNAFSRFHISEKQEIGLDALQSSKIKDKMSVNGVVSVVYLNQVEPQKFKNTEVFYVFMYLKDKSIPVHFTLNGEAPIFSVKKLTPSNEFTYLTSVDAPWNKYYLVTFAQQGDILKFKVENEKYSSQEMVFEKDE